MKHKIQEHWVKGLVFICSLLVIYLATFAKLDSNANNRIESSFKQALGVFATAKALNGVISLAQGTEVGVGFTFSIGEILDPINDLVERFSWIMLASLTSLGIQKILMNIVTCNGFEILLIVSLMVSNILLFLKLKKYNISKNIFFKFTMVLIFLRFSIPFMAIANEYVYVNFVKQDYNIEQSQSAISSAKNEISNFDDKKASYFSTDYYKNKIVEFQNVASKAADHIVDLIIVFIFQTMLFPILFLWFLYRLLISFSRLSHYP